MIADLRRARWTLRQIADDLARSPSTISWELRRNANDRGRYLPGTADKAAVDRIARPRARRVAVDAELQAAFHDRHVPLSHVGLDLQLFAKLLRAPGGAPPLHPHDIRLWKTRHADKSEVGPCLRSHNVEAWSEADAAKVRSLRRDQAAAAANHDQRDRHRVAQMWALVGDVDAALDRWEATH